MANICDNEIQLHTENKDNLEVIKDFFDKTFPDNWIDDVENGDYVIYFDSKWDFPKEILNKLCDIIPNKTDVEMTCLSVEWGNFYSAFHTFDPDEGWIYQN